MTNEENFRQELIESLRRELVGPGLPPHGMEIAEGETYSEVLLESPTRCYSAGILFPKTQQIDETDDDDPEDSEKNSSEEIEDRVESDQKREPKGDGGTSDKLTDAYDETIRMANEFAQAAMGISFIIEYPENGLRIDARASTYKTSQVPDPNNPEYIRTEWLRKELDLEPVTLKIQRSETHNLQSFQISEKLKLRAFYRRRRDNSYLVTISMINDRTSSDLKRSPSSACFFQVGFKVSDPDGNYIFKEYQTAKISSENETGSKDKKEEDALNLLYRERMAYAVGHGCAANWGNRSDKNVNFVETDIIPSVKIPPLEPRIEGGDELSMFFLSGAEGQVSDEAIPDVLEKLCEDYNKWITERETEIDSLEEHLKMSARDNLKTCRKCLQRIHGGINLLRSDEKILMAFKFANRAALMQQYHSRRKKRLLGETWDELPESYKPTDPAKGKWRAFQLAFILMNLQSISPESGGSDHPDRDLVDLMWFPTGGGKTEAYLGLAACDIFLRRLTRPTNAGCTVLMRYTLRLLTSQQFQRSSSMICACEIIRRENHEILGEEQISIGMWVGQSLTPILRTEALTAANKFAGSSEELDSPFQLLNCPWCGTALDDKKNPGYMVYKFRGKPKTVVFVCTEQRCSFSNIGKERNQSQHIPVLVIDEDIYDWPPTLIIGTVDKFAMLTWRERAGRIFGVGLENDCDPPDMVIQDELHLISGPLGSVVGLFESAIDILCSTKDRKPKIIASTATIRRASNQCEALYERPTFQFPPQGLDISDSFFAKEDSQAPGRIYTGVFAPAAPSFITAEVRTASSLLQSCKSIPLPPEVPEKTRDPYWTLVEYFNSLRELGHAATLVQQDIPEYIWTLAQRDNLPNEVVRSFLNEEEMTSRRKAEEIPVILNRLENLYPNSSDDFRKNPLDILLATNMISVGLDVDRLGLILMIGQPKTTSEYIQASSRVGRSRSAPGLVVTMYNPGRPRDRSHYEHFRSYHESFYKFVEPTSVTPYSLAVLDRALHSVLVILVRHYACLKSPDTIDLEDESIKEIIKLLKKRCEAIDPEHLGHFEKKISELLTDWKEIAPAKWGSFRTPDERPLMYPAGTEPLEEWNNSSWPTLSSMRNIDAECNAQVIAKYPSEEE